MDITIIYGPTLIWLIKTGILEFGGNLIVETPPWGGGFFQSGVRRTKYKLGPTKKFPVQIFASLSRVYISSSSPQSEKKTPRGGFLRSNPAIKVPVGLGPRLEGRGKGHYFIIYPSAKKLLQQKNTRDRHASKKRH